MKETAEKWYVIGHHDIIRWRHKTWPSGRGLRLVTDKTKKKNKPLAKQETAFRGLINRRQIKKPLSHIWLCGLIIHKVNLNVVLFCFLFSDLGLFLIFLGQVKRVLMAFTACPFWWSIAAKLLLWESSPPKHDSKDHVQCNAPLHGKISNLFENGATGNRSFRLHNRSCFAYTIESIRLHLKKSIRPLGSW